MAFDLGNHPATFDGEMVPLFILPIIGLVLVIVPQKIVDRILPNGPRGMAGKLFAWFFFVATSLVAGSWLLSHNTQLSALGSAESTKHLSVVEGCLGHFHPMPQEGHDEEKIEVAGKVFTYSDYDGSTP